MVKVFIKGDSRSWYAVGIVMGLGLLSKYTIALLGGSCLLYMLIASDGRSWFKRKEPYLAIAIAMAIFSPVIIWNAQNNWVSFEFQTLRRISGNFEFGLPKLIGVSLILITPLGLIECLATLFPSKKMSKRFFSGKISQPQKLKFFISFFVFTAACVFILFSLSHSPKTNWLGPIFLPALPFMAWGIVYGGQFPASRSFRYVNALWKPTFVASTLVLGIAVYMLTIGAVVMEPANKLRTYGPSVWKEVSESVEGIRDSIGNHEHHPIIVSMDKYFLPSELAFYSKPEENGQPRVAGRGFFSEIFSGDRGLMWNQWVDKHNYFGQDVLLVDFKRKHIERQWLKDYFDSMSPVQRQAVEKDSKTVCFYYWRVGHNYSKYHRTTKSGIMMATDDGNDEQND
jgi:dolichol-phosphate mannosyltransferase